MSDVPTDVSWPVVHVVFEGEDETEKTQRIAEEVGRMLTSLGIGFVGFDAGRGSTGGHGDADGHF
jgi:hypothetical protein